MSGNAYSIDGRTFSFVTPFDEVYAVGAYVEINTDAGRRLLGQVLGEWVTSPAELEGRGRLVAELTSAGADSVDEPSAFGSASIESAPDDVVADHLTSALGTGVGLALGAVQRTPAVPAYLHAKGFGRHTFLCGQSGSGKTYTLGAVLEQLLLETDITIVVADPNSDYVNLQTLRTQDETGLDDAAYRSLRERFAPIAERIHVFGDEHSSNRLRVKFGRLSTEQQTMVLGIDPIADPEIYNAFVRIVQQMGSEDYGIEDVISATRSSFAHDQRRLGLRIENLGVDQLSIWAGADEPMSDALPPDARMAVLDLGSLPSQRESSIAAAAVLGSLWDNRHARTPTIIVIDEAHNICPQNPSGPSQELATEHVVRIAGEGRKFGLYLLLATQRPEKVHQNVVSQCDNLILMKMNSAADIAQLRETFSYAPSELVEQASGFGLGEGLVAGKIAPDPLLFKTGRRYSVEGGSDVPSSWATKG
jgi:DNA helicase HerA-like ATPase